MRIFIFVELYPVPFKPYYDTQFSHFKDAGHDIRIFSGGAHNSVVNEKVQRFDLLADIQRYPRTLRDLPATVPKGVLNALRDPQLAARAARAAWRSAPSLKRKIVDTVRAWTLIEDVPDLCLIHATGTAVLFPWLKEVFPDTPIAFYYHGGEVPSVSPLADRKVEDAFHFADAVFTNTQFSRDHAVSRGCPEERIHILPVGFDLRDYQPPEDRGYRRDGILRLLSAGRMSEEKGFIYALKALRHLVHERGLTDIHYSLTGDGYIRDELETFVRGNDLEPHVTFLGTVTADELIRQQERADVLLLPSIQVGNWVENQACAVQETMLMKGLVVVSRTGGVPESVAPELSEFVVTERDWRGLADRIEKIYRMDDERIAELGDTAREFVVEHYDIDDLNGRLVNTTLQHADV